MNKQEAIKTIENIDTLNINDMIAGQQVDMVIKNQVLGIVSQIDQPQKVVVPKFVAEWLEEAKKNEYRLSYAMNDSDLSFELDDWMFNNKEVFARAWLDGYIVQEQLYTVEIPNPNLNAHTILQKAEKGLVLVVVTNARWRGWGASKLTEAEIKQDFEWAWQWAEPVEVE